MKSNNNRRFISQADNEIDQTSNDSRCSEKSEEEFVITRCWASVAHLVRGSAETAIMVQKRPCAEQAFIPQRSI
ncbi:hypothetical protein RB195_018814 [Necator americanus]|uniref:Uncharacterized protein n=1 Tax=Necator americanus TaxID=51031 RepID=A0ABR1CE49_NECAM